MVPIDAFVEKELQDVLEGKRRAKLYQVTQEALASKAARHTILIPMRLRDLDPLSPHTYAHAEAGREVGIEAAVGQGKSALRLPGEEAMNVGK